jgi:hypothetical protein
MEEQLVVCFWKNVWRTHGNLIGTEIYSDPGKTAELAIANVRMTRVLGLFTNAQSTEELT